ncbi:MAG: MFS transporter [Planctomycetota bacterium]
MRFEVRESLSDDEVEAGLRTVIRDGVAFQAMATLTGGVLLVGFAVELGVSNLIIGLLAAIPFLAQFAQIPAIYLVEKVRVRRSVCVFAALGNRLPLILLVLIPVLFAGKAAPYILLLGISLHAFSGAISACSWNSWMRDLVPENRLGEFFGRRLAFSLGLGIVLILVAGVFLDWWKAAVPHYRLHGYSIIFFLGLASGLIGVYYISRIPEPRMHAGPKHPAFFRKILKPFRDPDYRRLIYFMGSWNFAINLAAPFFTVYMLVRLGLEMKYVIALAVLSQIINVAFLQIWGRISDRFSNKAVLGFSGPVFLFCILAWTFTTLPEKYLLTVPLLVGIHIFTGISLAGVTLAGMNIGLKCAPKGEATTYLAANSLVTSLTAGVAPVVGGLFVDYFLQRELSWVWQWTEPGGGASFQILNFRGWDFLFCAAFLTGLYSIHRLTMVKEVGKIKERITVPELLAEVGKHVRNLSTARGFRYMAFPLSWLPGFRVGRKRRERKNP